MIRDVQEAALEAKVADRQRKLDYAKAEHGESLRELRKYRREKAKADIQATIDRAGMRGVIS